MNCEINEEIEQLENTLNFEDEQDYNDVDIKAKIRCLFWVLGEDIGGKYSWTLNE